MIGEHKKNLIGLNKKEIEEIVKDLEEKPFRAAQIWQWIYHHGVKSFDEMTNLSKATIEKLKVNYCLDRGTVIEDLKSVDGTRKWLVSYGDNQEVEMVFIPEEDRGSLCISSQIGCTLNCKFCHTGTQKLVRDLSTKEIVDQFMLARDMLGDWPSSKHPRVLTNIVMMGMGEPLLNYENVSKALEIIMDNDGICLSKRKITLSTSGIVPLIEKCGKDLEVNLAISLHAVNNPLRDELVPINKKYPIEQLLEACRNYPILSNARRITFEYVMLEDINDSPEDAKALIDLIKGIPAKINLIPFNPWPGSIYKCSSSERISVFADILYRAGYSSPVRKPRGQDILAACGQLKSTSIKARKKAA